MPNVVISAHRRTPHLALLARGTMTFARASRAAWHGASSVAIFDDDEVRRVGAGYVIENARTSFLPNGQRGFSTGYGWSAGSGDTITASAANGPDGSVSSASRIQVPSNGYSSYVIDATAGDSHIIAWLRSYSGAGSGQVLVGWTGPTWNGTRASLTETWQRVVATNSASDAQAFWGIADARAIGGGTDAAIDCVLDMVTIGREPYAGTDVIDAAREEDVLTWDPAEVPLQLREGLSIHRVHPFHSSAALARFGACSRALISFGSGDDRLELAYTGTDCRVRAYAGGSAVVTSSAVTWAADRDATGTPLSITCDPVAGEITLSGFSTGDGTHTGSSWAWPGGEIVRLGGVLGSSGESADGVVYLPRRG